jgi:DNA helicase-2/ATP-dependent DNA helicase PcrA
MPSQFLMELPADELQRHQPPGSYGQPGRFDVDDGDQYSSDEDHFDLLPEDDASFDFEAFEAEAAQPEDEAESVPSSPAATDGETPATSLLTTAAEMLGQARAAEQPRLPPDAFRQGMLVRHADHGPGTVVALSGSGAKRKATVQFLQDGCRRSYVLAYSKLWAVASDSSTR